MTEQHPTEHPVPGPAARLQAAADHLRTLLANPQLTAGPWLSMDDGDRLLRNQPGDEDAAPIYVVNEPISNGANAAWIAAMHPGMGAALISILEREAARIATYQAAAQRLWDLDNPKGLSEAEGWLAEYVERHAAEQELADAILAGTEQ